MLPFLRPLALVFALLPGFLLAAEPLPSRIDTLIQARAKGKPFSFPADDAEFLRRVTLDLGGRIPSAEEARSFLDDRSPDKRVKRIDALLAGAVSSLTATTSIGWMTCGWLPRTMSAPAANHR
jgi:Protein of unknown function (DUF1549)